ncbi:MAG: hypothetical protein QXV69_08155 [Sulfolobaceae archaeon]
MNKLQIGLLTIVLLTPLVPAAINSFTAFLPTSMICLGILLYLFYRYRPWIDLRSAIITLYFSTVFTLGITLGVFLVLPANPRLISIAGLIEIIPFLFNLILVLKSFIRNLFNKKVFFINKGYFTFVIIILIGALIGRLFPNFYQQLVIYSGTLVIAVLFLVYIRQQVNRK